MKITTFNPQIVTKNAEPLIKLFEELGCTAAYNLDGDEMAHWDSLIRVRNDVNGVIETARAAKRRRNGDGKRPTRQKQLQGKTA